jgi:perosamine synthetase
MHAISISEGDEVIVPAITFAATGNCVFHAGGKPVLCDVNPITGHLDPNDLEKRILKQTRAVIPVHLTGASCDMETIRDIASQEHLWVVEDACHALGGDYFSELEGRVSSRPQKICSCAYSDLAVTSFHPVKSITTGEGGAVFTNHADLAERVRSYRNHGITKNPKRMTRCDGPWYYEMQELGTNARLTDFQCALGQMQLKRIDQFIQRRRTIAQYYNESFADLPGLHTPNEDNDSAWHLYVIQIDSSVLGEDRLEVFMRLKEKGLGVGVHYIPLHFHPYYQHRLGVTYGDFPGAETYYRNSISIPIYPAMSDSDVKRTVEVIRTVILKLYHAQMQPVS